METQVPAIQSEQVADDVAPVTAEYVPAKTRDECTGKPREGMEKATQEENKEV